MGGSRRVTGLIAAAVAATGLVAAGCKPEVTKEVLFVNDSVTHQSIVPIVAEFNTVEKDATSGRYAPNFGSSVPGIGLRHVPGLDDADAGAYWSTHLTTLFEHVDPEVLVVELGYNDCRYDLSDYGTDIDEFLALVPSDTPVLWVTMQDALDLHTCDEVINEALAAATTRWPDLGLLDLAAHVRGHAEWVEADSRHLSVAGQGEYARWLHRELDARFLAPEPPPEPPPETTETPTEPAG
jgi:hypothetical protein